MFSRLSKTFLLTLFVLTLCLLDFGWGLSSQQSSSSEDNEKLEEICREIIDEGQQNLSKDDYQNLLKKCQTFYEKEIAEIEKDLAKTGQEKKTLQNKIYSLNQKIKNLSYQIYQSNLIIKDLGLQIEDTEYSIEKTSVKIEDSKEKLTNILRTIYEEDQKPVIEILLAEEDISDFFDNLMALEILNSKSKELLQNIKILKSNLEDQKLSLNEEKRGLEQTVKIQELQKQDSAEMKSEQEYYLGLTEQEYQKLKERQTEAEKKAAEIRAKIYELIGVRKTVTYEEALEIAKYAASLVGIRPALLLGVLSVESKIGKNVGQCYVQNFTTGEGVRIYDGKSLKVMNPASQVPYFLKIIEELNEKKGLNLNPKETLVSCPAPYGEYAGAMGPAQFMPATWLRYGYKKRVEGLIGGIADPWDLRDASLAASLYLKDGINRYGTESAAVKSYLCGSPRNSYWCNKYNEWVMSRTECHQQFIDKGTMSLDCQKAVGLK